MARAQALVDRYDKGRGLGYLGETRLEVDQLDAPHRQQPSVWGNGQ